MSAESAVLTASEVTLFVMNNDAPPELATPLLYSAPVILLDEEVEPQIIDAFLMEGNDFITSEENQGVYIFQPSGIILYSGTSE